MPFRIRRPRAAGAGRSRCRRPALAPLAVVPAAVLLLAAAEVRGQETLPEAASSAVPPRVVPPLFQPARGGPPVLPPAPSGDDVREVLDGGPVPVPPPDDSYIIRESDRLHDSGRKPRSSERHLRMALLAFGCLLVLFLGIYWARRRTGSD